MILPKAFGSGLPTGVSGLSAACVPGSDNTVADFKSRHFEDNTEWSLSPVLFQKLTQQFSITRVDLFASRLNYQVDSFVS